MDFLLIATVLLFLPGLSLTVLLKLDRFRYLLSFSLSYSLFVVWLNTVILLGKDAEIFTWSYWLIILLLGLLAVFQYRRRLSRGENVTRYFSRSDLYDWLVPGIIVLLVLVYYFYAGAYIELPADVFTHLEAMQNATADILLSEVRHFPLHTGFGDTGKYWYYLYSFIGLWAGGTPADFILPASIFSTTVFLLGVYFFSQAVFKKMQRSSGQLILISAGAVFFTFFHFGINIFSFVRYYALAPAILNFVLYFSVMTLVIDFFNDDRWKIKHLLLSGLIIIASFHIHRQEALFAALMISIMSFYLFFQKHIPSVKLFWQGAGNLIQISPVKIITDKVNIAFLLTQSGMVSLFIYSYLMGYRHPMTAPKVISLENIFPFFKNLYILNPVYQFYYVVTLWGAAVIILFILKNRAFRSNAYIMAGMLSPLFTVFNPFFTDLFMRYSWSATYWRISLLLPLHLVAGYLFFMAVQYVRPGSVLKKVTGLVIITILLLLLFPVKTTFLESPYSRILTLKAVPVENSPEHWADLIDFLNSIEDKKQVITDPVTGYMLTALTRHESKRAKFHRYWGGYIEFNYDDYSSNPLHRYRGYLLIVNKRNGGMSKTGVIARHWSEKILQLENFYFAKGLEEYIRTNPGLFHKIWEKDRVRVYSIGEQ